MHAYIISLTYMSVENKEKDIRKRRTTRIYILAHETYQQTWLMSLTILSSSGWTREYDNVTMSYTKSYEERCFWG
jgi:hypothetical protein